MSGTTCNAVINGGRKNVLASSDRCDKGGKQVSSPDFLTSLPETDSQGRLLSPQERFDNFVQEHGGYIGEDGKPYKSGDRYLMIDGKKQRVSWDLSQDVAKAEAAWKDKLYNGYQLLKGTAQWEHPKVGIWIEMHQIEKYQLPELPKKEIVK